jgi:glycosyltransferase involved in cell wall biosynthesis
MRVLMVIRPDADTRFGGDRVHFNETARHLRLLGADVDESVGSPSEEQLAAADIVHLFNLQTPEFTLSEIDRAKNAGKKTVISAIWWENPVEWVFQTSWKWRLMRAVLGQKKSMEVLGPRVNAAREPSREPLRKILNLADRILVNSDMERKALSILGDYKNVDVARIGIDAEIFDPARDIARPEWLPEGDYVLCVGRIEDFKGQHRLAKACKNLGLTCVLIGDVIDADIAEKCKSLGAVMAGKKSGDDLVAAYKYARVHAQPSRFELPGLSSLEAGAMGVPLIASMNGSAMEYLGEHAMYVDPLKTIEIQALLPSRMKRPYSQSQSYHIRHSFTWRSTAEQTMRAYRSAG